MNTKKNIPNIYLVLLLISLLILICYIVDSCIKKIHQNLESNIQIEKFQNKNTPIPSPSPTFEEEEVKVEKKIKKVLQQDNSFMYEIENKKLDISDFYPTKKVYSEKSKEAMYNFIEELDLFHQIIPKLTSGYLGIVWFDSRNAGIYQTDDLSSKKWTKLDKDIPVGMERPVFITYDKDRMLLGIFENKEGKMSLYKKECTTLDKEWLFVNKTNIVSMVCDKDDRWLGLDADGNLYKKSNEFLESEWEYLNVKSEFIPMRKLFFDYKTDVMVGIGQDFRIYKKRYSNWMESSWGEGTPKSLANSVRDVFYDYDGLMVGLSRVGLVKKKEEYYLSDFKLYEVPEQKKVSVYKLIYAITGIVAMAQYDEGSANNNNVYIDGKKISEYKFKDERLNKYLDYRMKLKKECRKLRGMKIIRDNRREEQQEQIRNSKFSRILNEQKNTIDDLMDTIKALKDSSF